MKIIFLISLLFFTEFTSAQRFAATEVCKYASAESIAGDTLAVQKISPAELDEIVKEHEKILLYFYKPYCPGLLYINGPDRSAEIMKYCNDKNVFVAFIAVGDRKLLQIHSNFINPYGIGFVHPYILDMSYPHSAFEKTVRSFGKKMKKSIFYIEHKKTVYQSYSYNADLREFQSFVK